jgi:D-serine deaminase-like pyridoxal phosphate-dependent protein
VTLGVRSGGSTPTAWRAQAAGPLTELRPGNYVFHDATQVALGVCSQAQCALRVLATVVSRPTPQRVVLDAGSKALGRERMTPRTPGYGLLLGDHAPLPVGALYEEHAIVEAPAGTRGLPRVGDRVELLPNHACVTANLHDRYVLRRGEEVVDVIAVDARGWG